MIEDVIERLLLMKQYLSLQEIHDRFVGLDGLSEGDLFLLWKAVERTEKRRLQKTENK